MIRLKRFFLHVERFYHAVDFYFARINDDWRGRAYARRKISDCDTALYELETQR